LLSADRLDLGLEETERQLGAKDTTHWSSLIERITDECHPEQRDFAIDQGRRIVGLVGRGGGKTTGGMTRFIRRLLSMPNARCVYIAVTRDHAERLMWQPLKQAFNELGFRTDGPSPDIVYNETKLRLTLPKSKGFLWLFGADKPKEIDKLRGLTFNEVGIDEAASHSDSLIDNLINQVLGPRMQGTIWLIGTPGHQLRGMFWDITRPGSKRSVPWAERNDDPEWIGWSLHKWSLKSAIENTKDRPIPALLAILAEQKMQARIEGWSDDNPIKRREHDGEWAEDGATTVYRYRATLDDGTPWNQWDPKRVGPLQIAELPMGSDGKPRDDWAHVIGMDIGYTDQTAINVFAFSPSDRTRTIYHRLCFGQAKMYAQIIAHKMIGVDLDHSEPAGIIGAIGEWPNAMVADSIHAMAKMVLAELGNVYGIKIEPAVKGYHYKYGAIEVVNGDLVDGRIKILKGSALEKQLQDLQWGLSKSEEQIERKDQPNDHPDSLVYARCVIATLITAIGDGDEEVDETKDPRSPKYVPPMPDEGRSDDDYSSIFQDDYSSML
jgi:hypothetical protein